MSENGNTPRDTLTVTDNRDGREYEVEILDGDVVRSMDLRQIKVSDDDFGMMTYDPAYTNTASTRSAVTYIDGAKGILQYRGFCEKQICTCSRHATRARVSAFVRPQCAGCPSLARQSVFCRS